MQKVATEHRIHGRRWHQIHGGYFADPDIAEPLLRAVVECSAASHANSIIDIGGGTGYLLSLLKPAGVHSRTRLVGIDCSDKQLRAARAAGIEGVRGDAATFLRKTVVPGNNRALFMMRSVLHYFGQRGLRPALRHIRQQLKPGEFFVHQTASFRREKDADCLNDLYRMMRTGKWYPTVRELRECLTKERWRVLAVLPCKTLPLTSSELATRYSISPAAMQRIRHRLSRTLHVPRSVLTMNAQGFTAFLHYHIFVCAPL